MKILIVEDEQHNSLRLQRLIGEISSGYQVLDSLACVEDTVHWIKNNPTPDVALMDIRLADGISFDIFQRVNIEFPVIFTTAYDEYAIRAFKVNSIDYLLKPIQKDELAAALEKVKPKEKKDILDDIHHLIEVINSRKQGYRKRFLLPSYDGYKTILTEEIHHIYVDNRSTMIVLNNGNEELISISMEDLEEQLDPEYFFRANRQMIIHISCIQKILNSFNGKLKIVMKGYPEKEVYISKEKAVKLKEWLNR